MCCMLDQSHYYFLILELFHLEVNYQQPKHACMLKEKHQIPKDAELKSIVSFV